MRVLRWSIFFILGAAMCFGAPSCQDPSHDSAFTREGLLTATADKLKATTVSATLEQAIPPGTNVLWCGTFQLAWNQISSLIGEDVRLDGDPPVAAALNRKAFTRADIDDASCVALAGFVRDGILDKIRNQLHDKFGGRASQPTLPSPWATRPQDIVAYAYLFKNLQFQTPFERLDEPIAFGSTAVDGFGFGQYKPGHRELYLQVAILDYRDRDDFVIELKTRSKDDRVILAKVQPKPDLGATVAAVRERIAKSQPEQPNPGDVLKFPKFNFDVTRDYEELLRRRLLSENPKVARDLFILLAMQNIRFQMNERGVVLRSESTIHFGCGAAALERPVHVMIFDKPFLVMFQRSGAANPYFALWAGNAELLVPIH